MNMSWAFILGFSAVCMTYADTLPLITTQPASQTANRGASVTLSVSATGAAGFLWRHNGALLSGANASTLQLARVQAAEAGYYVAIATNSAGWVPSLKAYLAVSDPLNPGQVYLSNAGSSDAQAKSAAATPISSGTAQLIAGPALDQLKPVGPTTPVSGGYFDAAAPVSLSTVPPGQDVYCRVSVSYLNGGATLTQQSTVIKLTAGGSTFPVPNTTALRFPAWPEWPEPVFLASASSPTNQVRLPGESLTLSNSFAGYGDYGVPTLQWRKDGVPIATPVRFSGPSDFRYGSSGCVLTLTNLQPSDAGTYDAVVLGNNWLVGPEIRISIQQSHGQGRFLSPQLTATNLVFCLEGAAGCTFPLQTSTNFIDWVPLGRFANTTGTLSVTNAIRTEGQCFFRTILEP